MNFNEVKDGFEQLSETEQKALLRLMQKKLFPSKHKDLGDMIKDIRETRFDGGLSCVHCGSVSVKRHGIYRGRQRYICKDCKKTFTDTTATPVAGTHYPEKWVEFIRLMIAGTSLRKISNELDIHISTVFYWRHKTLRGLRSLRFKVLKGIVETDDTFILESVKGQKNITHRAPRIRGGKSKLRGLSNDQISILVAIDRNGSILSDVAGRGRLSAKEIDTVLSPFIEKDVLICSDSATGFKSFAKIKGLKNEVLNASKGARVKNKIFHIQHVNSYHERLKDWMKRFRGVSTRHLNSYVYWFHFLESNKKLYSAIQTQTFVVQACKRANQLTIHQLRTA